MRDKHLDRLFDRFRRQGDVGALGEVFDRTAPELLRVAASLVRDANEADDLLQQTFLTAIERAHRYESSRRLVPWLLGILAHHARQSRRLQRRELDPARLSVGAMRRPELHALENELQSELERALGELPTHERTALEAHLQFGKSAAEIAAEIGVAPGAVRMRIHRGLDRLRRALPAGLALGGAPGAVHGQGLGAVRANVLAAAAKELAPTGAGVATGAGILGGILMGKKIAVGLVFVALAAGYYFLAGALGGAPGDERAQLAQSEPAAPRERGDDAGVLAPAPAIAAATPGPEREPARSALAADLDHAGLRGRVLEHDGTPVPGLPVSLLEIQETELFPAQLAALDAPPELRLVAAETLTDREGVFVLHGASAGAIHALGLDVGGARGTLRILEANLAPGATADLGDIVLAISGAVSGRVVDERGEPVAGARVRVGVLPETVIVLGMEGLSAGGAFAELRDLDEVDFVFDVPPWVSALEALIPLATTRSAEDGSFAFARVPAGRLTALVDAPGFAHLTSVPFDLDADEAFEVDELVLARGATAQGRVRDAAGRPVAGAEVRAGTRALAGGIALFGPVQRSGAEGRFAFEHLVPSREPVVLARRDVHGPWVVAAVEGDGFLAVLPEEHELVVEVRDAAGAPVAATEFFLHRVNSLEQLGVFAAPLLAQPAQVVDAPTGRFGLGALAPGLYLVVARAAGLVQASSKVEIGEEEPPVLRLTLEEPRSVEVLVLDAATRAPLAGALVRAENGSMPPQAVDSVHTGADGRAQLALPRYWKEAFWLRVEHPRFAAASVGLDERAAFEVMLTAGARLVARVVDPELARQGCALQLQYTGSAQRPEFHLPRLIGIPSTGEVVLERLPAGSWSWNLFESLTKGDPLALLGSEPPQHFAQGKFELAEGQTLELALGADGPEPDGIPGGASITGLVRVDGRPAGELLVNLCPLEQGPDSETVFKKGSGGRFRFDGVAPGKYYLIVQGARTVSDSQATLVQEMLEIESGEQRALEYDVERLVCRVRVLSADGEPVRGVELRASPLDEHGPSGGAEARSGPGGIARLELPNRGRYLVGAHHPEQGVARAELEVGAGEMDELTLTLSKGVDCAGTVKLAPGVQADDEEGALMITAPGDPSLQMNCRVELAGGSGSFRLVGLAPGKYTAWLYVGEQSLRQSFELPEWGNGALELSFAARDQ